MTAPLSSPPPALHLWCPELWTLGGIQRHGRYLIEALGDVSEVRLTRVFSKNDPAIPAGAHLPAGARASCAGRVPGKLRTPAFAAMLLAAGLRERPALVLSTHLNFLPVAHLLRRLVGVPYWAIAHGIEAWELARPSLLKPLREADRVLAVSRFTRSVLVERHGLDPARVSVLPNTFDASRFTPGPKPAALRERLGLRPDQPVILTVARVEDRERYKGYDQILRGLGEVRRAVPGAHYVLVGRGNDLPRVRALAAELGITDAVTFAGGANDEELLDYYRLCDVFAMPSKREGFGIVFLEALACGKPVIAGNVDGSVDPLLDGELGWLVDPDDPAALAAALTAALRREHPDPHRFDPAWLRARVVEEFALPRFKSLLAAQLRSFTLWRRSGSPALPPSVIR